MKGFFKKIVVALLTLEARVVLWRFKPRIVGVTGSVGKTTTKDAIATVLRPVYDVRESRKSFNSELGVPLTILGLDTAWGSAAGWLLNLLRGLWQAFGIHRYPEWLVLEMGVDHPDDMRRMARLVKLDAAVITLVGEMPVHVEFFSSPRAVFDEKSLILTALKPKGTAILGYDDEDVRGLADTVKNRVYTFGYDAEADFHADYYSVEYDDHGRPQGVSFKVMFDGNVVPVLLQNVLGRQVMYPVLAAFSVGIAQGLNAVELTGALNTFDTPPGRMRILAGKRNSTIIDDTYNASPVAVELALETLRSLEIKGRKIVVLGDMMELGRHSADAHAAVGVSAADVADVIVTVGTRAKGIADAAQKKGHRLVSSFGNAHEAGAYLANMVEDHDVVLVKGSQAVRLEHAVAYVMASPERKAELLVRQGKEWSKR